MFAGAKQSLAAKSKDTLGRGGGGQGETQGRRGKFGEGQGRLGGSGQNWGGKGGGWGWRMLGCGLAWGSMILKNIDVGMQWLQEKSMRYKKMDPPLQLQLKKQTKK